MAKYFDGDLAVRTERRTQLLDITEEVARLVREAKVDSGICYLYVPHTTAGITINENDDPAVAQDIENSFDRLVFKGQGYRHAEGNADSHIKTALAGNSAIVFIKNSRLDLGRWQGIFFCEFDGPRDRRVRIRIVPHD